MTGKRFSFDDGIIWENISQNSRIEIFPQKAVELLNVLNDENEQLKSRCDDYDTALKRLQNLTDKKIKENEQLKRRNKVLREDLKQALKELGDD